MMEAEDRLPDEWFSEEELDSSAVAILSSIKLGLGGHIVLYHLYKNGVDTGIVMLLAVKSISDGRSAINRMWGDSGIYAEIGEFSEIETISVGYKLAALELVLDKWKYEGQLMLPGSSRLYRYAKWFDNLVQ